MSKPNFAIGIPTLNRYDLLYASLYLYALDFKGVDINIIDNGNQHIGNSVFPQVAQIKIHEHPENLGVATSWNKLCDLIFAEHDYAVILNDDIYLGYPTEIIEKAIENSPNKLFIRSKCSWSMFIINKRLFDTVGRFDEVFYPAYYEDSDYIRRMTLKGITQEIDETLNPDVYRQSQTYEFNPKLVNDAMMDNRMRYIQKWGNVPLLETFSTPYNE